MRCYQPLLLIGALALWSGFVQSNEGSAPMPSMESYEDAHDTEALRAVRRVEQARNATWLGDYREALRLYRSVVREFPSYEDMASVRTRINVLYEAEAAGEALISYLDALDARDAGRPEDGIEMLKQLPLEYPGNVLLDDALYLRAYLEIMERYDFAGGLSVLSALEKLYPDSAYTEAAHYLEAIAHEQLGDTLEAIRLFEAIRDRHTAFTLPFGQSFPSGDVMSRYWFHRAQQRLDVIQTVLEHDHQHSLLDRRPDGQIRLDVRVEGERFKLLLHSSPLLRHTRWNDGVLNKLPQVNAEVFAGEVIGYENSWARVIISDKGLSGMLEADGMRYTLARDSFIGTIDWYQPRERAGGINPLPQLPGYGEMLLDAIDAPPSLTLRSRDLRASSLGYSNVRAVPLSIVIDSQYDRYFAGEGLLRVLNYLNVADQMYRQYGFALILDEVIQIGEGTKDPFNLGAVSMESILRNFRDYRMAHSTLFSDSGLVYLFTGNPRTDITLGLAWVDTACRVDGYDVGVTTPSTFGGLLLAHEVGHSLGALHDTDTDCADQHDWLMWPQVSEATSLALSQCSSESVQIARAGDCLFDTVDLSVEIQRDDNSIDFIVRNHDQMMSTSFSLDIEIGPGEEWNWPEACELSSPLTATCRVSNLLAGGAVRLGVLPKDHTLPEQPIISGRVQPLDMVDPSPLNDLATLGMQDDEAVREYALLPGESSGTGGGAAGGGSLHPFSGVLLWPWILWRRRQRSISESGFDFR